MLFPITKQIKKDGNLNIGNLSASWLKEKYGTPLYVMDIATIKKQCRDYLEGFSFGDIASEIIYASKAFSCKAMCQLIEREGLSIDVSTGGELFMALEAGFPPERIYFHGNNKSEEEIRYGLENNVGCFIVDNFDELKVLGKLATDSGKKQDIMLRITPGIKASTHKYIQTGMIKSKFGFGIHKSIALDAVKEAENIASLNLIGLHSHIGSQIFNLSSYGRLVEVMSKFIKEAGSKLGVRISRLNIGGGLGIQYTKEDKPPTISDFSKFISEAVGKSQKKYGIDIEKIYVEPGRSIVGNAGITLYEVGVIKEIPGIVNYAAVDGGMSDNIRAILYQAKYEAFIADRMDAKGEQRNYTIVGKHCESGDVLIDDITLPILAKGDLIAVTATGAYCFAMASNYNGQTKSAVVAVEDGKSWVWVQRENYKDLITGNSGLYE